MVPMVTLEMNAHFNKLSFNSQVRRPPVVPIEAKSFNLSFPKYCRRNLISGRGGHVNEIGLSLMKKIQFDFFCAKESSPWFIPHFSLRASQSLRPL
jgi:hypothetical protein